MVSVGADAVCEAADPRRFGEAGAAPEWRVLGRLEKTAIGRRQADGVTSVRRREPAGCLLYGPYWQLAAGNYRLKFRCRSGRPRIPGQPVLGVEVVAMNRIQLAWLDLTAEELRIGAGSVEFSVPPTLGLGAGDEARLEFRFLHMANADLTIFAVDLIGVEIAEMPMPAKLWRMLGRLEKTAIAKRVDNGVAVLRTRPAGRLLDGGRPYLQLPGGRYRLSFDCNTGIPRMASQPVLGIEIVAWRRWSDGRSWSWNFLGPPPPNGSQQAWRDFTAAELESGSEAIDFAVPAELSYEGGEEVLFDFRFLHLGNADLTISAVALRQVPAEEAAPATPREWRLLGRLVKGRIGARDGDCVTVRRVEPANRLLSGGRPDLQLSSGRYRLRFCCRSGLPQIPERPVLEVEIVARSRSLGARDRDWRVLLKPRSVPLVRRAFTAEALLGGWGWVEFDVPAELSRESDETVRLEFDFWHLANADLTISEVTLQETADLRVVSGRTSQSSVTGKRTNVVIIGNCQAQTVYEALIRTREFNARLDAKYHFVGLQQNLHELGRSELQRSDILLVQEIRDWENYPLRSNIPDGIPIITFPLLHFASLWPFDHYNGPGDKEAYDGEWPNLTFLYLDGLLARLRKEIPDREQRLAAYRSLSVDGIINYVRLHDFEKRRLVAMDDQFGFNIGRFILDNFQRKRLFYTTNHPNGQIIAMLMQYLLRHLEIGGVHRQLANLDHLNRLQVPVHPKVAKALGVKWADEKTKYRFGGEQISWETYTRRYIDHYG